MGIFSKSWTIGCVALGLAAASQLPEFAQQYRQRLGGAIEELQSVVADFDQDAAAFGLSRDDALTRLRNSAEALPRARGVTMARTIERYENLLVQRQAMESADPLVRPIHILSYPDQRILAGTWQIFEPAVPLTPAGILWGAFGGLLAGGVARLPVGAARLRRRRKRDAKLGIGRKAGPAERQLAARTAERPAPSLLDLPSAAAARSRPSPETPPRAGERVSLEEKIIGEIGPDGRIVRPRRSGAPSPGTDRARKD